MKQKIYLALAGLFLLTVQLKAQAPDGFNYQGVARNSSGAILSNQPIGIEFTILQGSATGTMVYQETHTDTTNEFGLFTATVGKGTVVSGTFSTITWGANSEYLEVGMDPTGGTTYATMGTQQLLSVPYALFAGHSGSPWTTSGTNIYNNNSGSVGIGTTTPSGVDQLDVKTNHSIAGYFETDSLNGYGGYFVSDYIGSKSYSEGNTGLFYIGSYDEAVSTTASYAFGTLGIGFAVNGMPIGLYGTAQDSGFGTAYGVYGEASSGSGVAYGLYGIGAPVGGYAYASGNGINNLNEPYSSDGLTFIFGLDGEVTGDAGSDTAIEQAGVFGTATNPDAEQNMGVFGSAYGAPDWNMGLYGVAQTNGTTDYYTYGVYADINPNGSTSMYGDYAGYFNGDVDITGNLSKSGGTFKIDDPLDPANKYLYHSFVESPDMMNVYNGEITTDANGDGTVALPQYFQAENKDFKYQLTVIGQFAQAIVATRVNNNQFTIKTNKPNVAVSWQVTGVRNDPWANDHRVVAEVEKKGIEKGHYLFPQYYGQPKTMSIGYLMNAVSKANPLSTTRTTHNPVARPQLPTTGSNTNATPLH